MSRNCLLKHVIEGKMGRRIEVMGGLGRRHKQVLGDLQEKRGCRKLKEDALDFTLWGTECG